MNAGRRGRLSREQVARAALAIVDEEGLEALSMRRVADDLGVGTMTLYSYVRGKDELLDAVIDAAVEDVEPFSGQGSWQDQVRELMKISRDVLTRHPGLVQIRFRRPVLRPEALRFGEAGLGILTRAGFDKLEAAHAFRLLFTYGLGFVGLSPEHSTDEARREAAAAVALLPPDVYPNLTGAAREVSFAMAGDEAFNYGLERILDGLTARLEARNEERAAASARP